MPQIIAYTDGACSGNPGPGGWGALLQARKNGALIKEKTLCGGEKATTNNRMEITAAIEALQALDRPSEICVRTDSQYLRNGITVWVRDWKKRQWRRKSGQPVKNADLWKRLDDLCSRHEVTWQWVKGHANEPGNEKADQLARGGMAPFLK